MRDYNTVVQRVEALQGGEVSVRELGQAHGFPVFHVTAGRNGNGRAPTVYVNGGTHGDEPASVEGVLAFLETAWTRWAGQVRFEVIPCLNPWGFVHNVRGNAQKVDVNWAFLRDDVPEVAIVKRFIDGRRFAAVVDLHEDWESPGYYVYELFRGQPPVGAAVVSRVAAVCPLNTNAVIEGEQAENGVIHPRMDVPKRRDGEGIPVALFQKQHTDHLVVTETPSEQPMAIRVAAQLATLEVVIASHAL